MSIPVRHSGRIAFAALIVIALIAALLGVRLFAVTPASPPRFETDTTTEPTFTIGPIEGLTTTWHWAPPATSIPLGTLAWFFQPAPRDTTVNWTGADEVARDDQGSTAVCWLVLPGITMVKVQVIPADGGEVISSQSRFNVVDVPIEQITVSAIDVWVDPVQIDEGLSQDEINEQTMDYFFGPSIAALRDLGDDQYRTSVNRKVHMSVEVDPPGFAPLIEWRFDGQAIDAPPLANADILVIDPAAGMGTAEQRWFPDIGNHLVEVGPLLIPEQIEIETYSVTITSHTSGEDIIEEGEPIVFIAETDPPGYEDEITWLSSTLYGTAEPILGEGPIFIAEFNDTWGIDENGDPFQWLGVKADNAMFNQDDKCDEVKWHGIFSRTQNTPFAKYPDFDETEPGATTQNVKPFGGSRDHPGWDGCLWFETIIGDVQIDIDPSECCDTDPCEGRLKIKITVTLKTTVEGPAGQNFHIMCDSLDDGEFTKDLGACFKVEMGTVTMADAMGAKEFEQIDDDPRTVRAILEKQFDCTDELIRFRLTILPSHIAVLLKAGFIDGDEVTPGVNVTTLGRTLRNRRPGFIDVEVSNENCGKDVAVEKVFFLNFATAKAERHWFRALKAASMNPGGGDILDAVKELKAVKTDLKENADGDAVPADTGGIEEVIPGNQTRDVFRLVEKNGEAQEDGFPEKGDDFMVMDYGDDWDAFIADLIACLNERWW